MKNKSKTIYAFLLVALSCLHPTTSFAGADANAYVTVTSSSGTVKVSADGMNFHLSPEAGAVSVSVSPIVPYILDAPNPNTQTILPHNSLAWKVHSEDNETGKTQGAWGQIGFCDYKFKWQID